MKSMRILFCNYEYPPLGGGGGVVNALLAQELAKRHEVTVLTSQGLALPSEEIQDGVKIIRVPVFFRQQEAVANLFSLLAFIPMGIKAGKELLRKAQFDIINTHFALPTGPVGEALSRFGGIPNVLSLHGGDLYDPSKFTSPHRHPLLRFWIRHLLKQAAQVVGQSRNTVENMHRYYDAGMESSRIPLGIKRPKVDVVSRSRYGFQEEDCLLITVGRLVARKGISQLINLMESFQKDKVRLVIIGSGPEEAILKKKSREKGLEDNIYFTGYLEEAEKFQLLGMSDIYVTTSQHEGFGLVFLEAMACGLPILCYDKGGQTDFLVNEETGYVLPLNDLSEFKVRCHTLINEVDLRKKMGQENLRKVEDYFIETCAERYESLFQEVIQTKSHNSELSEGSL